MSSDTLEFTCAVMNLSVIAKHEGTHWLDFSHHDKAKVIVFSQYVRVQWTIRVDHGDDLDHESYRPPLTMGDDADEFAAQVLRSYFWLFGDE
jgi:hypothetical protein